MIDEPEQSEQESIDIIPTYHEAMSKQPKGIPHIEAVLRQDKLLCRVFQNQISQQRTLDISAFYRLMAITLSEYEFASVNKDFETALRQSQVPSVTDDTRLVPLNFIIGASHISIWTYYADKNHQLTILIHYLNVVRPALWELVENFFNIGKTEDGGIPF